MRRQSPLPSNLAAPSSFQSSSLHYYEVRSIASLLLVSPFWLVTWYSDFLHHIGDQEEGRRSRTRRKAHDSARFCYSLPRSVLPRGGV